MGDQCAKHYAHRRFSASCFSCVFKFVFSIVSGRLLGRPVGRPRAPYAMHTDVSAFHIVLCWLCPWGSLERTWGRTSTKVMYTACFCVFGSVFARRDAAPGVSLEDSLGDPLGGLGLHMLCTPMFQRFSLFSAECVLGGSLGRTWGCFWDPEGFLVGPRGVLGATWRSLETP